MFLDNYQRSMEGISSRLLRLVYATSGVLLWLLVLLINPWSSLGFNSSIRCIESEREALLAFKQGLVEYDNAGLLSSWRGSGEDCCKSWEGVQCDNQTGHVLEVDLWRGNGYYYLRGTISPKLIELRHLKYLDLSNIDFSGNQIPEFIGSLSNLRYLFLSDTNFSGQIPYQLGNLTNLQCLDLSYNYAVTPGQNLNWLPHLSSLNTLILTDINLGNVFDWFETINKLPKLTDLMLIKCSLPPLVFPSSSLSYLNSSKSLTSVSLFNSHAVMPPSIFKWLCNSRITLVYINLSHNPLSSPTPIHDCLGNMTSLEYLAINDVNYLEGEIPPSFSKLCNLEELSLFKNNLSGQFSQIIEILSACGQHSLEHLDLSSNQITGSLPDLTNFSSLKELYLSRNQLIGKIPESIGKMFNLETFYVGYNALEGMISETHFSQLSKLQYLDLSSNSLVLNFHSEWVPPFQLVNIHLQSCKIMGKLFPNWLRTQKNYSHLELSNAGISDFIPSWFWGLSSKIVILDLSCNQIRGTLGNFTLESLHAPDLNFSSNQLKGAVPSGLAKASSLDLSNNKISGLHSFFCNNITGSNLVFLDVSSNHVSEQLFDCRMNLENLLVLDLSDNFITGSIPSSIGSLFQLEYLNLRHNRLAGQLPSSLKNCTHLTVIDVGENELSGPIPEWLGINLSNLVVLMLQSNHFSGSLPSQLCHLSQIHMLDFSMNNISGTIPKCLDNFTRLAQKENSSLAIELDYNITSISSVFPNTTFHHYFEHEAIFIWKGMASKYKSTLGLVKIIDLSSNRLTGEIPSEITHLVELVALNLSRNQLTGQIPPKIGNLQSLDFLDLSRNQIDGRIPTSLARIDGLSYLDLSYNKLSGKIPNAPHLQTFEVAYQGNSQLCGPPLQKRCPEETNAEKRILQKAEDDELITNGFCISMALGFVIGFWGVCGSLIFNRSWRYAYFKFLNVLNDWLYVRVTLIMLQLSDMLNRRS